jgi:AcrR family transcriptional regulator
MTAAPVTAKRIRRTPSDLRAEAMAASRRLIIAGDEPMLTMKAVADAIGVTYPNLSHHFGSAAGLHAAVAEEMVRELLVGLREIADELNHQPDSCRLVDRMFDLFGRQGLSRVINWLVQSGEAARLDPVRTLLSDYITEVSQRHGDGTDRHIAKIAMLVSMAAHAEASAGPLIGDLLGFSAVERRDLLARMIDPLMAK